MFAEGLGNDLANRDAHEAPREHVIETKWVATGCLLVHRRVYEAMLELPEVKAGAEYRDTAGRIARQYGFFTSTVTAQGEDMAFSARARAIGEKMVVDFGCVCGHVGDHAFWPHNTRPNVK
jgi:hypothetical protein